MTCGSKRHTSISRTNRLGVGIVAVAVLLNNVGGVGIAIEAEGRRVWDAHSSNILRMMDRIWINVEMRYAPKKPEILCRLPNFVFHSPNIASEACLRGEAAQDGGMGGLALRPMDFDVNA